MFSQEGAAPSQMISYEKFGPFYDAVMGNRAASAQRVRTLLQRYHPKCRSVLELACGTGSVLLHLQDRYEIEGLDISPSMLRIARRKLRGVRLHSGDMRAFRLSRRFDAVICVFDSINHLVKFSDWKRVFARAHAHLNDGGLLLFDVNTLWKLKSLGKAPIWVHDFDRNVLLMDVSCDDRGLSQWDIRVFERRSNGTYRLHREVILEKAFPTDHILDALRAHFRKVQVLDTRKGRVTLKSDNLHFVACK